MENLEVMFKNEIDKKRMLDYILHVAQMRQISQSKLIDGIYDKSHFNRMCNGKENINLEVIIACSNKLGIKLHQLIQMSLNNQYNSLYSEFENTLYLKDFNHLTSLLEKINTSNNSELIQLKYNIHGILYAEKYNDYSTAINCFKKALEITCPNFFKINNYLYLSIDEIKILENLALCYFFNGNDNSFIILKKLITDIQPVINEFSNNILTKLCYNYSLICLRIKNYNDSLLYCNKGIETCIKYNNFLHLGYLYYNKAYSSMCLDDELTCIQSLKYAKEIFTIQHNIKLFNDALLDDIEIFGNVISAISC